MGRCPQHLPFAQVPLPVCHETSSSVTKQSFLKTLFTPEKFENAGFVTGLTVDISGNAIPFIPRRTTRLDLFRMFPRFIIQRGLPWGLSPRTFPRYFPISNKVRWQHSCFRLGQPLHESSRLRVAWLYRGSSGACVSRLRFQLQCRNSYTLCCGWSLDSQ